MTGALAPTIDEWVAAHTVDEVLDLASTFRIPNAPIANGANITTFDHFRARGTFVPTHGTVRQSPAAFPAGPGRLRRPSRHPVWGSCDRRRRSRRARARTEPGTADPAPIRGAAGARHDGLLGRPAERHVLALLGAEVIHLESTTRPMAPACSVATQTEDHYWERGPIFAALNTNK